MPQISRSSLGGYLVHIYTASSLIFITLGIQWVLEGHFRLALLAIAFTIIIDATDGTLARRYRVKETAAGVDGALLDNIVDYLSYVVLPMVFMMQAEMFLTPVTMWVALVMFTSAFGFSKTTAKLANEGFFVGFPSYWNIMIFYLFLLNTPPILNTALAVFFSLLVFIPIRFLYVSRLPRGRWLHVVLGSVWGVFCLVALALDAGVWRSALLYISLIYPVYYTLHSLQLNIQHQVERRSNLAEQ